MSILTPNMVLAAPAFSFFLVNKTFSLLATKALCFLVNIDFSSLATKALCILVTKNFNLFRLPKLWPWLTKQSLLSDPRPSRFRPTEPFHPGYQNHFCQSSFFHCCQGLFFLGCQILFFHVSQILFFLSNPSLFFLFYRSLFFFGCQGLFFLACKGLFFLDNKPFLPRPPKLLCFGYQSLFYLGTTQNYGHQTLAAFLVPWTLILGKFLPHCTLSSSALWHPTTFGPWPLARSRSR